MYDVITFGGATRDIFFKTSDGVILPNPKDDKEKMLGFKYGQKIITDNAHFSFGGGAFNSAVSMAKLGLNVAVCINIGRDESAHSIVERLRELGVNTSFVTTDPENHTAMSLILVDKGEHIAILHRGANNFLNIKDRDKMKEAKWFYITSLTGQSHMILPEIIQFASKYKIKVAFNPGSVQLKSGFNGLKNILKETEILVLNKEEAEELYCSENICKILDEKALVLSLLKMGPKSVVITDGKNGSYYGDADHIYYEEAFANGREIDTTGAGDAFGSAFLTSIVKGFGKKEALKVASVDAASVVSKVGAQSGLLSMAEIKNILAKTSKIRIN